LCLWSVLLARAEIKTLRRSIISSNSGHDWRNQASCSKILFSKECGRLKPSQVVIAGAGSALGGTTVALTLLTSAYPNLSCICRNANYSALLLRFTRSPHCAASSCRSWICRVMLCSWMKALPTVRDSRCKWALLVSTAQMIRSRRLALYHTMHKRAPARGY
jgi:hypothetical protein